MNPFPLYAQHRAAYDVLMAQAIKAGDEPSVVVATPSLPRPPTHGRSSDTQPEQSRAA
jgi:hypothetical protein